MMIHMGHGHGVYIDAALKMARKYPNIWLEMSGMPMPSKIREAYETVGHDRIMFGTDTPFHDPSVELQKVLVSGVDEEGIQKILYDNAAAFSGWTNDRPTDKYSVNISHKSFYWTGKLSFRQFTISDYSSDSS